MKNGVICGGSGQCGLISPLWIHFGSAPGGATLIDIVQS